VNLYRYVGNDPPDEIDPEGLCYPKSFVGPLPCGEKYCDDAPSPAPNRPDRRRRQPTPDDDPRIGGGGGSSCFERCLRANGAEIALAVVIGGAPFAPKKYSGNKEKLGSGNKYTTRLSEYKMNKYGPGSKGQGFRKAGRALVLVPFVAAGYLGGLEITCAIQCAENTSAW